MRIQVDFTKHLMLSQSQFILRWVYTEPEFEEPWRYYIPVTKEGEVVYLEAHTLALPPIAEDVKQRIKEAIQVYDDQTFF